MIAYDHVVAGYPSEGGGQLRTILADVNLTLRAGELVCLLGPSGCGKTTLLNLAAGFAAPLRGRVLFRDAPVSGPSPQRAVVFQEATLFPWLTVWENVAFGLRCRDGEQEMIRRRVAEALGETGLTGSEAAHPHELSGGMRQRAALARVLVLDPPVLLMDEPFGALDANTRERLQETLLGLLEAHRRTVLFVTHSVDEAAYLADRVAILGPPPTNIRAVVSVEAPRPRHRASAGLLGIAADLRRHLDEMPCCVGPE